MAIDTETKRRSTLGLWTGPRVLPVSDGTMDVTDRYHMSLYSGLVTGAPPEPPSPAGGGAETFVPSPFGMWWRR